MSADPKSSYKFGDSAIAAERLQLLAVAFEPSSRAFLAGLQPRQPQTIADLGCGPGYTTRMLAELFPSASVRGIDSSERFIALAECKAAKSTVFEVADVTQPLPGAPYDLIYARYLLTHVPDFQRAMSYWSTRLTHDGAIAIEENQWIETQQPAFGEYLAIVSAMLAEDGQRLFVGAELDALDNYGSLRKTTSALTLVSLSRRVAAGLFLPNLQTWRSRPFIQRNYDATTIERLEVGLQSLVHDAVDSPAITFGLRQMVLQLDRRI
jgi:SAM-dependent methyltransferase